MDRTVDWDGEAGAVEGGEGGGAGEGFGIEGGPGGWGECGVEGVSGEFVVACFVGGLAEEDGLGSWGVGGGHHAVVFSIGICNCSGGVMSTWIFPRISAPNRIMTSIPSRHHCVDLKDWLRIVLTFDSANAV